MTNHGGFQLNKLILAISILVGVVSQGFAASILILNGAGQPEVAQDSTNVSALKTALGNTVAFAGTGSGRSRFAQRNNSIFAFISGLGGGTFSFVASCSGLASDTQIQVAIAPFNGPNPVNGPNSTAIGAI